MPKPLIAKRWSDLVHISQDHPFHAFRGQASSNWALEPSLHRAIRARSYHDDCDIIEYALLRAFRRGAGRYLPSTPAESDYVSWLALMQHHGTPSRLLDFTYSYAVAAYFALIEASSESAIWIVSPISLLNAAGVSLSIGRHEIKADWQPLANEAANRHLSQRLCDAVAASAECSELGVIPVEPFSLHDRLARQQGMFLMPIDALGTIESNLKPLLGKRNFPLQKVVIREQVREEGLKHLREMNVTAETLFPGFDGFAKSLLQTQLG